MKKNPKIIVLVLCSRNYLSFISSKAQQKIWSENISNFKITHFIGSPYKTQREIDYILENDINYLVLETDDGYPNLARKTYLAFEHIYSNYDFDFLFRTNTSSFIDFKKLRNYVVKNYENLDYCGSVLDVVEGDTIASGAGFFISKKNVELILNNNTYFDDSLPDDVAIARLLNRFKISPQNLIRRDLKSVPTPSSVLLGEDFHYRCRLDPNFHRILEPLLMKYLKRVSELNGIFSLIYYYLMKIIFKISNFWLIYKVLQKFYSYKFYGEINIKQYVVYKKNKLNH